MAILKIEVDTQDIYSGYEDGMSFEDLINKEMKAAIVKDILTKIDQTPFEETAKEVAGCAERAVEDKLKDLINEDLAFVDRWGKPTFVGTVEDYIKKQIDEKLMAPVNAKGKAVTGCSTSDSATTWLQWAVRDEINNQMCTIRSEAYKIAQRFCKNELDEQMEKFTTTTLRGLIVDKLDSVGLIKP